LENGDWPTGQLHGLTRPT